MKRPSSALIAGGVALLIAGCASLVAYKYLKRYDTKTLQGVSVLTAAADVPVGTKLDTPHLRLVTWPKESLPPGYATASKAFMGRVTMRPLNTGDIITEQKLLPLNATAQGGLMTYIVPHGHRAVTVAVNEVAGVAGFLTPNSRVDIVLLAPLPGDKERDDNTSKIILQNIPVLAIGQGTEQKEGKPTVVPTVTLDMSPEDAEKVIVGTKKGSLQLLLRNAIDTATTTTRGTTISAVLGRGDRTAPAPVAAPKRIRPVGVSPPPQEKMTVEIIKGGAKTTREFTAP